MSKYIFITKNGLIAFFLLSFFYVFFFCRGKHKPKLLDNIIVPNNSLNIKLEVVCEDVGIPWGLDFLPDGSMIIADKNGQMFRVRKGHKVKLKGLPKLWVEVQAGLLDLQVHPNYEKNKWIYCSYTELGITEETGRLAVMRFKLFEDTIIDKQTIFQEPFAKRTPFHFGARLEFDKQEYLYVTVGDRFRFKDAQNLNLYNGKIHRLNEDGTIPKDNPFVDSLNAIKSIYAYGLRNSQGLSLHPFTGELWEHEHGPMGGDELNIIRRGNNYGWPKVTFGLNYDGSIISYDTIMKGIEAPIIYWTPSIAPSSMTFISTARYGENKKGNLLLGSLKYHYLHYCVIKNNKILHQERWFQDKQLGKVRVVREAPDGFIYMGTATGKIFKLIPF